MQTDNNLIEYLEGLSYLTLTDDEKQRIKGDLKEILEYMAVLSNLDTTGVAERSHPFDDVNVFRDDISEESFERELILKNAYKTADGMFLAPKTVG